MKIKKIFGLCGALTTLTITVALFQNFTVSGIQPDALAIMTPAQLCEALSSGNLPINTIDITEPAPGTNIVAADPTGHTNSYNSFQSAAEYFSNRNDNISRVLIIPKGIYSINNYIDPIRDIALMADQKIHSIEFKNSSYFRVIGCNAEISVKGDFYKRPAAAIGAMPGRYASRESAVAPFVFSNSSYFGLYGVDADGTGDGYGLELNGNVDKMSRDLTVVEDAGHGIKTLGCHDYELSNLNVHHFSADGFYIGGGFRKDSGVYRYMVADFNGKINNVVSSNNARQGISIIQANRIEVNNSSFLQTGRTAVSNLEVNPNFPGFSPQAGVDIEPNYDITPVCILNCNSNIEPKKYILTDKKTAFITFNNSIFSDNIGLQIVSAVGNKAYKLTFNSPTVVATYVEANIESKRIPNSSPYVIWFEVNGAYILNGKIQTQLGAVYASKQLTSKTYIQDSEIRTKGAGLKSSGAGVLRLLNSKIVGEHQSQYNSYMPYIQNGNPDSRIARNTFFFPKEAVNTSTSTNKQVIGLLQKVCNTNAQNSYSFYGNTYTTDLASSTNGTKLYISFSGSRVGNATNTYSGDSFPNWQVLMPWEGSLGTEHQYFKQDCNNQ